MFIALSRRLPTPVRMIHHLDRWAPLRLKRQLLEPQLNQLFGEYIAAGEFDLLEGRFISLKLRDLDISITLTLSDDRLQLSQRPGKFKLVVIYPPFYNWPARKPTQTACSFNVSCCWKVIPNLDWAYVICSTVLNGQCRTPA
jgi:hypothetical protein